MKAIVSLSGGMDSATVLGWLITSGFLDIEGVSFTYGSKHNPYENAASRAVAAHYGIPLRQMDLSNVMSKFNSALLVTGEDIPEGHYTHRTLSQTVVPGRNMIFLSILAGYAQSVGAEHIGIGAHQGDHVMYPDCRKPFITAMNDAIRLGTDGTVEIVAPFVGMGKKDILLWGTTHDVPYHLTRTCYKAQTLACGKCGSCVERLEAFEFAGLKDPAVYGGDV